MKSFIILTGLLLMHLLLRAQNVVVDPWHTSTVITNGAVRSAAESAHDRYLQKINTNVNDLNTNISSVVLAQTMIYNGQANVNSALKDGLQVKNMATIITDIVSYIDQSITLAKRDPALLAFTSGIAAEMRTRSTTMISDVSGYILKSGNNVLADYNARDKLLHDITVQLQILDGLAYGMWRAMYWAKERGIIAALNPFNAYINQDKLIVGQIIQNAKYLRQ
jgi:hypothetical protein